MSQQGDEALPKAKMVDSDQMLKDAKTKVNMRRATLKLLEDAANNDMNEARMMPLGQKRMIMKMRTAIAKVEVVQAEVEVVQAEVEVVRAEVEEDMIIARSERSVDQIGLVFALGQTRIAAARKNVAEARKDVAEAREEALNWCDDINKLEFEEKIILRGKANTDELSSWKADANDKAKTAKQELDEAKQDLKDANLELDKARQYMREEGAQAARSSTGMASKKTSFSPSVHSPAVFRQSTLLLPRSATSQHSSCKTLRQVLDCLPCILPRLKPDWNTQKTSSRQNEGKNKKGRSTDTRKKLPIFYSSYMSKIKKNGTNYSSELLGEKFPQNYENHILAVKKWDSCGFCTFLLEDNGLLDATMNVVLDEDIAKNFLGKQLHEDAYNEDTVKMQLYGRIWRPLSSIIKGFSSGGFEDQKGIQHATKPDVLLEIKAVKDVELPKLANLNDIDDLSQKMQGMDVQNVPIISRLPVEVKMPQKLPRPVFTEVDALERKHENAFQKNQIIQSPNLVDYMCSDVYTPDNDPIRQLRSDLVALGFQYGMLTSLNDTIFMMIKDDARGVPIAYLSDTFRCDVACPFKGKITCDHEDCKKMEHMTFLEILIRFIFAVGENKAETPLDALKWLANPT
jgi:hypothetical protein